MKQFSGNILLVDDEPALIDILGSFLEEMGLEVDTAEDGKIALELFSKNPNKYHGIISDVNMPNLNGEILHGKIKEINPNTFFVFMSGSDESELKIKGDGVLGKPFDLRQIQKTLAKFLD